LKSAKPAKTEKKKTEPKKTWESSKKKTKGKILYKVGANGPAHAVRRFRRERIAPAMSGE
jgi:hypothetical protein